MEVNATADQTNEHNTDIGSGTGAPPKKAGRTPKPKAIPNVIEGLTAGNEVAQIALADIDLTDKTWQFRVSLRVGDLKDSILAHGQQLPVILRRRAGHAKLQVISGFRRLTAISAIGWPTAHGIILDDVSEEAAFRLSVLENEKRKTYSDLDRAHAITKYRQMGLKVGDIAKDVFGLSRKQVERLQKLTELPVFMQEAISEDALSTTSALVLKQLHDNAPEGAIDLAVWSRKIVDEDISVRNLRASVLASIPAKREGNALYSTKVDDQNKTIVRFKPIRVNIDSIAGDERAHLVQELESLLAKLRS